MNFNKALKNGQLGSKTDNYQKGLDSFSNKTEVAIKKGWNRGLGLMTALYDLQLQMALPKDDPIRGGLAGIRQESADLDKEYRNIESQANTWLIEGFGLGVLETLANPMAWGVNMGGNAIVDRAVSGLALGTAGTMFANAGMNAIDMNFAEFIRRGEFDEYTYEEAIAEAKSGFIGSLGIQVAGKALGKAVKRVWGTNAVGEANASATAKADVVEANAKTGTTPTKAKEFKAELDKTEVARKYFESLGLTTEQVAMEMEVATKLEIPHNKVQYVKNAFNLSTEDLYKYATDEDWGKVDQDTAQAFVGYLDKLDDKQKVRFEKILKEGSLADAIKVVESIKEQETKYVDNYYAQTVESIKSTGNIEAELDFNEKWNLMSVPEKVAYVNEKVVASTEAVMKTLNEKVLSDDTLDDVKKQKELVKYAKMTPEKRYAEAKSYLDQKKARMVDEAIESAKLKPKKNANYTKLKKRIEELESNGASAEELSTLKTKLASMSEFTNAEGKKFKELMAKKESMSEEEFIKYLAEANPEFNNLTLPPATAPLKVKMPKITMTKELKTKIDEYVDKTRKSKAEKTARKPKAIMQEEYEVKTALEPKEISVESTKVPEGSVEVEDIDIKVNGDDNVTLTADGKKGYIAPKTRRIKALIETMKGAENKTGRVYKDSQVRNAIYNATHGVYEVSYKAMSNALEGVRDLVVDGNRVSVVAYGKMLDENNKGLFNWLMRGADIDMAHETLAKPLRNFAELSIKHLDFLGNKVMGKKYDRNLALNSIRFDRMAFVRAVMGDDIVKKGIFVTPDGRNSFKIPEAETKRRIANFVQANLKMFNGANDIEKMDNGVKFVEVLTGKTRLGKEAGNEFRETAMQQFSDFFAFADEKLISSNNLNKLSDRFQKANSTYMTDLTEALSKAKGLYDGYGETPLKFMDKIKGSIVEAKLGGIGSGNLSDTVVRANENVVRGLLNSKNQGDSNYGIKATEFGGKLVWSSMKALSMLGQIGSEYTMLRNGLSAIKGDNNLFKGFFDNVKLMSEVAVELNNVFKEGLSEAEKKSMMSYVKVLEYTFKDLMDIYKDPRHAQLNAIQKGLIVGNKAIDKLSFLQPFEQALGNLADQKANVTINSLAPTLEGNSRLLKTLMVKSGIKDTDLKPLTDAIKQVGEFNQVDVAEVLSQRVGDAKMFEIMDKVKVLKANILSQTKPVTGSPLDDVDTFTNSSKAMNLFSTYLKKSGMESFRRFHQSITENVSEYGLGGWKDGQSGKFDYERLENYATMVLNTTFGIGIAIGGQMFRDLATKGKAKDPKDYLTDVRALVSMAGFTPVVDTGSALLDVPVKGFDAVKRTIETGDSKYLGKYARSLRTPALMYQTYDFIFNNED